MDSAGLYNQLYSWCQLIILMEIKPMNAAARTALRRRRQSVAGNVPANFSIHSAAASSLLIEHPRRHSSSLR